MIIDLIAFIVCVVGAIVYVIADKSPKAMELGRLAYVAGLLVLLLHLVVEPLMVRVSVGGGR